MKGGTTPLPKTFRTTSKSSAPPAGFQPRALPPDGVVKIGPARLVSQFNVTTDGVVHATWRFDTIKGRYTQGETEALLAALGSRGSWRCWIKSWKSTRLIALACI